MGVDVRVQFEVRFAAVDAKSSYVLHRCCHPHFFESVAGAQQHYFDEENPINFSSENL